MMPVDKLTLIRPTSVPQAFCAQWHSYRHIKHRQTGGKSWSTYVQR